MKAYDFSYDGKKLSDFGFVICNFGGSKGLETISNGSQITFNTVPVFNGAKYHLTSTTYDDCLTATIQICKTPCGGDSMEINPSTFRTLTSWLCRKKFLKLKFFSDDYIDLYFEAIINISRVEIDGKLVGLELEISTNRPFALKEKRILTIENTEKDGSYSINDTSYEEGYIYPRTEITIAESGNLNIYNAIENRNTYIGNCVAGEIITLDYPIIQSSVSSHNIQNDFNWNFFRIANTIENSRNDLTISIPCTIKIEYSPIVKVGL